MLTFYWPVLFSAAATAVSMVPQPAYFTGNVGDQNRTNPGEELEDLIPCLHRKNPSQISEKNRRLDVPCLRQT